MPNSCCHGKIISEFCAQVGEFISKIKLGESEESYSDYHSCGNRVKLIRVTLIRVMREIGVFLIESDLNCMNGAC